MPVAHLLGAAGNEVETPAFAQPALGNRSARLAFCGERMLLVKMAAEALVRWSNAAAVCTGGVTAPSHI